MSDPSRAVFLSYASQDAEAARKIREALRTVGIEVWFDQSELVGGDAWDQKIRKQIKDCALFVPIISANTQARREGYFRLEWKLAEDRTHLMARGTPFLVPVCIDGTKDWDAIVPDSFMTVQWTRIATTDSLDAFRERLKKLLSGDVGAGAARGQRSPGEEDPPMRPGHVGPMSALPAKKSHRVVSVVAAAAIVALAGLFLRREFNAKPQTPASELESPTRPPTEAQRLIVQARGIADKIGYTREELALAEEFLRKATELEPGSSAAWAARAYVHSTWMNRGWDRSPERAREVQTAANRALGLNPEEVEALMAQGLLLYVRGAEIAEAESFFRRAMVAAPTDVRPLRFLGNLLSNRGQTDRSAEVLEQAARLDPRDVLTRYILATHHAARGNHALAEQHNEAALALKPDFSSGLLLKAALAVRRHGDLVAMRTAIDRLPPAERSDDRSVFFAMWAGLLERSLPRVQAAAALGANDYLTDSVFVGPKAWLLALAYQSAGQETNARLQWQAAEAVLRTRIASGRSTTLNQAEESRLALVLAALGRIEEAARTVAAVEAAARERPTVANHHILARYYATLGDAVRAAPYLRYILQDRPNQGYGLFTTHLLRLEPDWDKLRGQPAFEALLEEFDPAKTPGGNSERRTLNAELSNPPPADSKSVAVLAFANLSDDKDNEYFSDGISEELLNVLAKVPGLKVSARTSAFSFKAKNVPIPEIARQLGVAYVVEGSVRKAGSRVRITAQLIKTSDGFHVWSDNFDRELKDIFAVQDEIAGLIAGNLSLKLGAASPAAKIEVNPEAYRLYLEGRQAWQQRNEAGYRRAESLYQRALQLQPGFALAHVGMARVGLNRGQDQSLIGGFGQDNSPVVVGITNSIERALELDPALPEAHASLGSVRWMQWRFADGIRELRLALALNPNDATSHQVLGRLLLANGEIEEAVSALKRAHELDPLFARIADNYSLALFAAGRYDEALQLAERALALQPDSRQALRFKITALAELGRVAECREGAKQYFAAGADSTPQFASYALARVGERDEAEAILKSANAITPREPALAAALLALGRREECLNSFRPANFMAQEVELLFWPIFDEVRADPRFKNLLAALGMTAAHDRAQAWRAANRRTEDGGRRTDPPSPRWGFGEAGKKEAAK